MDAEGGEWRKMGVYYPARRGGWINFRGGIPTTNDAAILFGSFNGRVSHGDEAEVGGGFGSTCATSPGGRGGDGVGGVGVDDADGGFGDSSAAAEE